MHDMTPARPDAGISGRSCRFSWALVAAAILLVLFMRVHAFYIPHNEGDEVVYLTLAREMGWDLSHYTTQHDPVVSTFPYTIYQQPLFFHPPLFPFLLKVGSLWDAPVFFGLFVQLLVVIAVILSAHAAARRFGLSLGLEALLLAGIVADPLLLFSTTRLHHDALAGGLLFCGLIFLLRALDQGSRSGGAVAGFILALALNSRFNTLPILPLLAMMAVFACGWFRPALRGVETLATTTVDADVPRPGLLRGVFFVAGAVILIVGLQHYVRMWLTYGTLLTSSINAPIPELIARNIFLTRLHLRDRIDIIRDLLALFPLLLIWLTPGAFKAVLRWLREGSWAWVPVVAVWILVVAHVAGGSTQTRYYAIVSPFFWLGFVLLLREARGVWQWTLASLAGLTLLLGLMTQAWLITMGAKTAEVVPFLYRVMPFLGGFAG